MFNIYNVYLIDSKGKKVKYIDTVKAPNQVSAEERCYVAFGTPNKNSGWARINFKAELA